MTQVLHILDDDKAHAKARITELEQEIQAMGPAFYDVFNQSSETWHDNAPFEALRDKQSVLDAELQNLRSILRQASTSTPKPKKGIVGIGSRVNITNLTTSKQTTYDIAGDWTPRAGHTVDGATIISSRSPIGSVLYGKKIGTTVSFKHTLRIDAIE